MQKGLLTAACVMLLLFACCDKPQTAVSTAAPTATTEASAKPAQTHTPIATPALTPSPTPTPTPALAPSPTPTPTPEPTPEPITKERLDAGEFDAYFDDAVFIGDSLTRALYGYVREQRSENENFLGKALFMSAVSMSVKNACTDRAYPGGITFMAQGKAVSVTEGITARQAKKAFIMLGVNDIGFRTWESVEGYYARLIDAIHTKCPDTVIIMQGVLPVTSRYCEWEKLDIDKWNSFNTVLERICEEHSAVFLNFADEMKDEQGYLPFELTSDRMYHLSESGNEIWVRSVRLYAAQQLCPDSAVVISQGKE
ncbi:MAG: SGNH/GDSL hydrolase family protein [Clostridia bacterium]|nr:SGNH/GDSL hydrolase family protein [Clostridia bacterium]